MNIKTGSKIIIYKHEKLLLIDIDTELSRNIFYIKLDIIVFQKQTRRVRKAEPAENMMKLVTLAWYLFMELSLPQGTENQNLPLLPCAV